TGVDIAKENGLLQGQFHSFYIDVLVSGGIVELLFILITLIYVITKCMKHCPDSSFRNNYIAAILSIFVLAFFESIGFFSIGYVDTIYTIFFITIPLLMSNPGKESNTYQYNQV